MAPRTLFAKMWDPHVVDRLDDGPDVLAIDLHLIHEVTSLDAFKLLKQRGLKTRHPERTLGVADHIVPVVEGGGECDLSNMRTLCLKCHRAVTALLRTRLLSRDR